MSTWQAIFFALIISSTSIALPIFAQEGSVYSPLKQIQFGILPQDVKCKENLVLVIKSENGSPACVTPHSSARLLAQGWVRPDKFVSQPLPEPKGYLGAIFTSSGTVFPLSIVSTSSGNSSLNIPQLAASGSFSFLFSNSTYSKNAFSVSYQSCNRNFTVTNGVTTNGLTEIHQSCTKPTPLDSSYGQNSQGQYAVTTKSTTLPCGGPQTYNGNPIPTKYYYVIFSVKTINFSSVAPVSYGYTVYANC